VTDAQYSALFAPGGAQDPTSSARLVQTRRPGVELVVSSHKSVAELGVIGYEGIMHGILHVERDGGSMGTVRRSPTFDVAVPETRSGRPLAAPRRDRRAHTHADSRPNITPLPERTACRAARRRTAGEAGGRAVVVVRRPRRSREEVVQSVPGSAARRSTFGL
jgi:hypothetical protein